MNKSENKEPFYKEKKGCVIYLDMLGARGMWLRRDPDEIIKAWRSVQISIDDAWMDIVFHLNIPSIDMTFFSISDTVIITISVEKEFPYDHNSLIPIVSALAGSIFCSGIKNNVLYRGAISVGKYYEGSCDKTSIIRGERNCNEVIKNQMLFGPVIDDVVEWGEATDWAGLILTPTTSMIFDNFNIQDSGFHLPEHSLIEYEIPFKAGKRQYYAVNWPIINFYEYEFQDEYKIYGTPKINIPSKIEKEEFRNKVIDCFESPISIKTETKMRNTIAFLNESLNKLNVGEEELSEE